MEGEKARKVANLNSKRNFVSRRKLGELLIETGILSAEQLAEALDIQRKSGGKLGKILIQKKLISEEEMAFALAMQLKIPYIDLNDHFIEEDILESIPEELLTKFTCVPIELNNKILNVAMADPLDLNVINDLQFITGYTIQPSISTASQIIGTLQKHYSPEKALGEVAGEFTNGTGLEFLPGETIDDEVEEEEERKGLEGSPFIKMVDLIIKNAIKKGASDIHIEAQQKHVRVRNRIDGMLHDSIKLPKWMQPIIVSRIKVLGNMDISEKRLPQDGRIKVRAKNMSVDLRVSTLPTYHGEKVVIRILNKSAVSLSLADLGFSEKNLGYLKSFVAQPQGMILFTGPTGSGKTSSLYACIQECMAEDINIITVEDPVEYEVQGINQVQIQSKVGLTFPYVLRSILRQDPNVIMIGEIRDMETAEIAIQASLTGHLVLSTLHTNDAPSAVTRLIDMGIPPYLITSSVMGVIAQRLIRKICPKCKEEYVPDPNLLARLSLHNQDLPFKFYHGAGCSSCGNLGYKGRTSIEEVLIMGHKIRELISSGESSDLIREAAVATGMTTLGMRGLKKIEAGTTTLDEVLKAVQQKEELTSICPTCGKGVSLDFKDCPYCKEPLVPSCGSCGRITQREWVVCPHCGNDLASKS